MHHDKNEPIIDEWNSYKKLLSESANSEILKIPASEFIKKSNNSNYKKYFKDRYLIE